MKKKLTILGAGIVFIGMTFMLSGCSDSNYSKQYDAAQKEEDYQVQIQTQSANEVGMPEITEFYEKKMAKEILELRDDSKLVCYAYTYSNMTGKYTYLGKCMGYGLPYSTQYTNPDQALGSNIISQSDPNGLYSGEGLAATWLMMIDETTGERSVMYCEPEMTVSQTKIPARLVESFSLTTDY